MNATPSLAAYRTEHRIQVDDSGPLPVCAIDSIRIHPTKVGGWFHDAETIRRLHRDEVRTMSAEEYRVARVIERISADFTAEVEDESDFNVEGQPEFNGAFR